MKKKKYNTVILLFAVISIWGYLGFQLFNFTRPKALAGPDGINQVFKPKTIRERDTFSLSLNYRNPFEDFNRKPIRATTAKASAQQIKTNPAPDLLIVYMGLIRENDRSKMFFLSINNRKMMLRKGQKFESIKIVDGDETQIVIDYQGKRTTYKIN